MTDSQNILNLAVSTGEALLKNGSEIYRVQDTVTLILKSFNFEDFNVYVVSNGIFASVNESQDDACYMIRHTPLGDVHLERITALNQLSREICSKECSIEEAYAKLETCKNIPCCTDKSHIAAGGIGSGAFCFLLGGNIGESIAAFFLGLLLQIFLISGAKKKFSKFLQNIVGSFIVTAGSILIAMSFPLSKDMIVIGSIITLVPGVTFTTSIRDFFNGDYLSGTIHLIDALLTAICIAIGVGAAIITYSTLIGGNL